MIAVLSMLHESAERNSASRTFRDRPVLDWTLRRLAAAQAIERSVVLCWDDQAAAAQPVANEREMSVVTVGGRYPIPSLDAVTAARRWADGWRGGPLQTCEFDRGFHAAFLVELAKGLAADALVLVDPSAGMVDAALIDQLVEQADANVARSLIFSQAAPGLSGVVIRRSLLEQLAAIHAHPGKFVHYQPSQPTRDPISEPNCVVVPTPVARTTRRFTLDTDRQLAKFGSATAPLNGQLIRTDAESLVRLVSGEAESASPPREVVLELTTRRATRPVFAPAGHMNFDRGELTTADAAKIIHELTGRSLVPLAPVLRGEGSGVRGSSLSASHSPDQEPLTPALSPEYRGEGGYDDVRLILGGVGDPLLAPNVFDVITTASAAGVAVHLRTDLLGVTPEIITKLAESPVDVISVQIPAVTAQMYFNVMGVDGLHQVIENIKQLVQRRTALGRGTPLVAPVFTKCRQNAAETEIWYDKWLAALGSAVIHGPTDYAGQIPDCSVADMTPPARRPCVKLASRLHVLSDGRIAPCEQDPLGVEAVGSICDDQAVSSAWTGPLAAMRADHARGEWDRHPLCARCREWHRP